MKPPIFCFDIDGTLISTGGAGTRAMKQAVKALFQKDLNWSGILMAGRLDPSIYRQILALLNLPYEESIWQNFQRVYLDFLEAETANLQGWKVMDGVFETLDRLTDLGAKKILMTGNIRQGAYLKLRCLNLHSYFDWEGSVFGDEGKERRDELAEIYFKKHGKELLPVVIGDTPDDIRVGYLAGGVSIAVSTGIHSSEELSGHEPHYNLESLKDFPWQAWAFRPEKAGKVS